MVILFILLLIVFFISFYFKKNNDFLVSKFKDNNTIVFGAKGTGKDLLFQLVIYKSKLPYLSNIDYGYSYSNISLKDISVAPNTFESLIENNITIINKNPSIEGVNIFISDAGIYLPSQYDSKLSKEYASLPIFYALSRHLYNSNIHINTQALNRVWVKLREQSDHYFKTLKTIKFFPFVLLVKVRYFSEYQSAENNLLPMNKSIINKFNKGLSNQYEATNGIIKDFYVLIWRKKIFYDSRHFHKVFFGSKFNKY